MAAPLDGDDTLNLSGLSSTDEDVLREMLDYLQIEWPLPASSAPPAPRVPIETPQLQWDPHHCTETITLEDDYMVANKAVRGDGEVLASMPATSFGVLVRLGSDVEVGFMPLHKVAFAQDSRKTPPGWFFRCSNGTVRSQTEPRNIPVVSSKPMNLIFLQVTWHKDQERISFAIDGVALSAGLHNVPKDATLYPCLRFASSWATVKLLPV
ncbi:hypothetical protein SPRG_17830 [Saprolegnia parasitica CBS 223.65]|uniref:SPRY domain-containing protein n=1 Tax=Saprolegnia parasitica (strain CBS 223.65) TaxID=695850 RepID=A0A067BIP5_SAPPC|nr:hypothetical protein SPRG_17830 [Saprolegnia parasitica CBS 223.65]KDO16615.1 hypothetical protein SPRG_17830 [Saprolegnia parasitica CBS 223.65]|eukprot:XP_012212677.1 hypothetical protein SPRG_17830 [Saprolegnia parasitica CBS 223.65]